MLFKNLIQSSLRAQQLLTPPTYQVRHFQTSNPRKKLPALLFLFIKPLTRLASVLIGRGTRKAWNKLPEHQKRTFREIFRENRGKFLLSGSLCTGGLFYIYESHIQICPITGRRKFVALTPDQARKIGESNFKQILEENEGTIIPDSDPVYNKVSGIANRILRANRDLRQIYDKTWTLTVIDAPVVNAFVLPSGNIFVFTGLLEACENEDEVGVVLSHEISHVVLGHVEEKLTRTSFLSMLLLVPMALLWVVIPHDGVAIVTSWFFDKVSDIMLELPFSRFMEMEADDVGLTMAAKACFDVRYAPAFWAKLDITHSDELNSKDLEFISTHPANETRQENLQNQLQRAIDLRRECGCLELDPGLFKNPVKTVDFLKNSDSSKFKTSFVVLET